MIKRRLWLSLSSTFAVIFIIFAGIYYLVGTPGGLMVSYRIAREFIPGSLTIETLHGRLLSTVHIRNLNYQSGDTILKINELDLNYDAKALLRNHLLIKNLIVKNVIWQSKIQPSSSEKLDFSFIKTLPRLTVQHFSINNVLLLPFNLQLNAQGNFNQNWKINGQLVGNHFQSDVVKAQSLQLNFETQGHNENALINAQLKGTRVSAEKATAEHLQVSVNTGINLLILAHAINEVETLFKNPLLFLPINHQLIITATDIKFENYLVDTFNFEAGGKINPVWQLQWQLHTQLARSSAVNGQLKGQGTVIGSFSTPILVNTFLLNNVHYNDWATPQLQINNQLNLVSHVAQLKLNADRITWNGYQFYPIDLQAQSNLKNQSLDIVLKGGNIAYSKKAQKRIVFWQQLNLNSQFTTAGLIAKSQLILNDQQHIRAQLELPGYRRLSSPSPYQRIAGNIQLTLASIARYFAHIPGIHNPQGRFTLNFSVAGTFKKPIITGRASLQNGQCDIPALNLKLRNIMLSATGNQTNINWIGNVQSGNGSLKINGKTALTDTWPSTLKITGQNIVVSNLSDYQITVSPNLDVNYQNKVLSVKGILLIPNAKLDLGGLDQQTVQLSSDVVFVDQPASNNTLTQLLEAFNIDVLLKTGNKVQIIYKGLNADLAGSLSIKETPGRPLTADGEILLNNGVYNYHGQSLKIRSGSRIFYSGGAIDNPSLNIQAIKTVTAVPSSSSQSTNTSGNAPSKNAMDLTSVNTLLGQPTQVTVGVNVQGTAQNTKISLFAQPAILTQTDILSYLLTGASSNQLGASSAQLLLSAVTNMNSSDSKVQQFINNLQKGSGLAQLSIEQQSVVNPETNTIEQNTALVLGKNVSQKLSINYSVGLLQAINTLQIRYLLTKNWMLQSTTNNFGSGVDLLYMLERD